MAALRNQSSPTAASPVHASAAVSGGIQHKLDLFREYGSSMGSRAVSELSSAVAACTNVPLSMGCGRLSKLNSAGLLPICLLHDGSAGSGSSLCQHAYLAGSVKGLLGRHGGGAGSHAHAAQAQGGGPHTAEQSRRACWKAMLLVQPWAHQAWFMPPSESLLCESLCLRYIIMCNAKLRLAMGLWSLKGWSLHERLWPRSNLPLRNNAALNRSRAGAEGKCHS